MSGVKGWVGAIELQWKTLPRGGAGEVEAVLISPAEKTPSALTLRWRRVGGRLWIELPDRVVGYDLIRSLDDDGVESFRLEPVGKGQPVMGLRFSRTAPGAETAAGPAKKKNLKIKAQMPGKVVRLLVKVGDSVAKNQPVLVLEAMKMENEIRAPQSAQVIAVKVSEGQAVETGAELITLE